ncbi:MAG: Hsp20/alpha crystallin family protein [Chloroflexota bacterium]
MTSTKQKNGSMSDNSRIAIQAIGWQLHTRSYAWSPPTDIYETEGGFVVRVELAGMHETGFTIKFEKNFLIITGSRVDSCERRAYHQMEIRFGEFNTTVEIPQGFDLTKADANYEGGFLMINIPKSEPTDIPIQG